MMASKSERREMLIVFPLAAIFVLAGMGLIYVGTYFYRQVADIRSTGLKTRGTVIRYEWRGPSSRLKDSFLVPIVRFTTNTGRVVVTEGKVDNVTIQKNLCSAGETVEVIYDPQNPEKAVLNTFAELWFAPLLAWIIGIGFVLGPPFTIWRHYRSRR